MQIEFEGAEHVPTGIVWDVVAVNRRDDGKYEVTLERFADGQMITSTMVLADPDGEADELRAE
jgi:hypothetical protein